MLVFARLFGPGIQQTTLHLDVSVKCTVGEFKAAIRKQHPDVQITRLLFGGSQLTVEDAPLVDYHIQKESSVQVFGKKVAQEQLDEYDSSSNGSSSSSNGSSSSSNNNNHTNNTATSNSSNSNSRNTGAQLKPKLGQDLSEYGDVLVVHLLEARNLVAMDRDEGLDTSDPYVIFALGNQTARSSMIERTLDPRWNETFGFLVEEDNMHLSVIVMDHDMCSADDPLGAVNIAIKDLKRGEKVEQFFTLTGVPHGEVHLSVQRAAITSRSVRDVIVELVHQERPWTRQDLESRYLSMEHLLGKSTLHDDLLGLNLPAPTPGLIRHQSAPAPNGQFRPKAQDPQHPNATFDVSQNGISQDARAAAVKQLEQKLADGKVNLSSERGADMVTGILAANTIAYSKDNPTRYVWMANLDPNEFPDTELEELLQNASGNCLKHLQLKAPTASLQGLTHSAFAIFSSRHAALKAVLAMSKTDVRCGFGRDVVQLDHLAQQEDDAQLDAPDKGLTESERRDEQLLSATYHTFVRFSGPHPVGGEPENVRRSLHWRWAWMAVQPDGIVQLFPSLHNQEPAVSLSLEDVLVDTKGPWSLQVTYQTQDGDKRASYLMRAVDPAEAKTWMQLFRRVQLGDEPGSPGKVTRSPLMAAVGAAMSPLTRANSALSMPPLVPRMSLGSSSRKLARGNSGAVVKRKCAKCHKSKSLQRFYRLDSETGLVSASPRNSSVAAAAGTTSTVSVSSSSSSSSSSLPNSARESLSLTAPSLLQQRKMPASSCVECLVEEAMTLVGLQDVDGIKERYTVADLSDILSTRHFNQYLDATLMVLLQSEKFISCPNCKVAIEAGVASELSAPPLLRTMSRRMSMDGDKAFITGQMGLDEKPLSAIAQAHCLTNRFTCRNCSTVFCRSCSEAPYHMGFTCEHYVAWRDSPKCRFCHGQALNAEELCSETKPAGGGLPGISEEEEKDDDEWAVLGDSLDTEQAADVPLWINQRFVDLSALHLSVDINPVNTDAMVIWSKGEVALRLDHGNLKFKYHRQPPLQYNGSNFTLQGPSVPVREWSTITVHVDDTGVLTLSVASAAFVITECTRNNSSSNDLKTVPLRAGVKLWNDSEVVLQADVPVPAELEGATLIQTRKHQYNSTNITHYGFTINRAAYVYVLLPSDEEAPRWLQQGFRRTGGALQPEWDRNGVTLDVWRSCMEMPAKAHVNLGSLSGKNNWDYVIAVQPSPSTHEWLDSAVNMGLFMLNDNDKPMLWGAVQHTLNEPFKGQMRNLRVHRACLPAGRDVLTPYGRGKAVGALRKDDNMQSVRLVWGGSMFIQPDELRSVDEIREHHNTAQRSGDGEDDARDTGAWIGHGDIQKDFWAISMDVKPHMETAMCVLAKGHESGGEGMIVRIDDGRLKLFNVASKTWLEGPNVPALCWSTLQIKYARGMLKLGVKSPRSEIKEILYTPDKYEYQYSRVIYGTFVKFKVKAAAAVHIALSSEKRDMLDMYEIALGAYPPNTSLCVIRRQKQGHDLVSKDVPDVLHPDEWRDFWVGWVDGVIRVGTGTTVGSSELFSWTDPKPLNVKYCGISTGWGETGSFDFNTKDFILASLKAGSSRRWLPSPGCSENMFVDVGPSVKRHHLPQEVLRLGTMVVSTTNSEKTTTTSASPLYTFQAAGCCRLYLAFRDSPETEVPTWVKTEYDQTELVISHPEAKFSLWKRKELALPGAMLNLYGAEQKAGDSTNNYVILAVPFDEDAKQDSDDEASRDMVVLNREFEVEIKLNNRPFLLGSQHVNDNNTGYNTFFGHIKNVQILSGQALFREMHKGSKVVCCADSDCVRKALEACPKQQAKCSHPCYGFKGEGEHCLPCLHDGCENYGVVAAPHSSAEDGTMVVRQVAEDQCSICYVDTLAQGPCIQLTSCGHVFHNQCLDKRLESKWAGKRIDFQFLGCPLCKTVMEHPALTETLRPFMMLRKRVATMSLARLKFEGLEKDEQIVSPASNFHNQPTEYAMHRFAFNQCFVCKNPYFAGAAVCGAADVNNEWDPADLVCAGCQGGVNDVQSCPKHGTDWLGFKCRFCCTGSIWFCFSKVHFCEPCHNNNGELVSSSTGNKKKLHEYTQCPGLREMIDRIMADARFNAEQKETRIKKLVSDPQRCPLGIRHPPNGIEYGLGCILCQEKEEKNEHADMKLERHSHNVDVANGYEASYNRQKSSSVGIVQAIVPLAPLPWLQDQKLSYYEVNIINSGKEGKIGVGLAQDDYSLSAQPGWEANSYGYHGDDGMVYPERKKKFGPFTSGDVVGCGIDHATREIFFTLNGVHLGSAITGVKSGVAKMLHATVGFHSDDERIKVNFGQDPFKYASLSRPASMRQQTPRTFEHALLSPGLQASQSDCVLELREGPRTWQSANTLKDLKDGTHHFELSVLHPPDTSDDVVAASDALEIRLELRPDLPEPIDVPVAEDVKSEDEEEEKEALDEEDEESMIIEEGSSASAAVGDLKAGGGALKDGAAESADGQAGLKYVPPVGVQNDIDMKDFLSDGQWQVVYDEPYSHQTKIPNIDFPNKEEGYLFVAAREVSSDKFYVGAVGILPGCLMYTNSTSTAYESNGAYWYNYKGKAFGFAPVAEVGLGSADSKDRKDKKRLSWHQTDSGGWRAGEHCSLNTNVKWRKHIYYRPLNGSGAAKVAPHGAVPVSRTSAGELARRAALTRDRRAYCAAVAAGKVAKELTRVGDEFDEEEQALGADAGPRHYPFQLLKAEYGTGSDQRDVLELLQTRATPYGLRIPPKKQFNFTLVFGDAAPGRLKSLTLEYEWRGKKRVHVIEEQRNITVVLGDVSFVNARREPAPGKEAAIVPQLCVGDNISVDVNFQARTVEFFLNGWSCGEVMCAELDVAAGFVYHLHVAMRSKLGRGSAGAQVVIHRDREVFKASSVRYDLQRRRAARNNTQATLPHYITRKKKTEVFEGMLANALWEVTFADGALVPLIPPTRLSFADLRAKNQSLNYWQSTSDLNAVAVGAAGGANTLVVEEPGSYIFSDLPRSATMAPKTKYQCVVELGSLEGGALGNASYELGLYTKKGLRIASISPSEGGPKSNETALYKVTLSINTSQKPASKGVGQRLQLRLGRAQDCTEPNKTVVFRSVSLKKHFDFVAPQGVQHEIPESFVEGWRVVYDEPYKAKTKIPKIDFPSITKGWLFVAARKGQAGPFYLGAVGQLPGVLEQTKSTKVAVENNGAYWYNYKDKAFGFAGKAEIQLSSADAKDSSDKTRLSWHQTGSGGYRAGDKTGLNSDESWRKYIFWHSGGDDMPVGAELARQASADPDADDSNKAAEPVVLQQFIEWSCPACTLINEGNAQKCAVCETARPDDLLEKKDEAEREAAAAAIAKAAADAAREAAEREAAAAGSAEDKDEEDEEHKNEDEDDDIVMAGSQDDLLREHEFSLTPAQEILEAEEDAAVNPPSCYMEVLNPFAEGEDKPLTQYTLLMDVKLPKMPQHQQALLSCGGESGDIVVDRSGLIGVSQRFGVEAMRLDATGGSLLCCPSGHEMKPLARYDDQWYCDAPDCNRHGGPAVQRYRCLPNCNWDYCGDCFVKLKAEGDKKAEALAAAGRERYMSASPGFSAMVDDKDDDMEGHALGSPAARRRSVGNSGDGEDKGDSALQPYVPPRGVVNNIPGDFVEGWTSVYDKEYADQTKIEQLNFPDKQTGWIFVAAREGNKGPFKLGAVGKLPEALLPTNSTNKAKENNGAFWYNYTSKAFGFSPVAEVNLSSADSMQKSDNRRLSWHQTGSGGWRAGDRTGLNSSKTWRKYIFWRPELGGPSSGISKPMSLPRMPEGSWCRVAVTADLKEGKVAVYLDGRAATNLSGTGAETEWGVGGPMALKDKFRLFFSKRSVQMTTSVLLRRAKLFPRALSGDEVAQLGTPFYSGAAWSTAEFGNTVHAACMVGASVADRAYICGGLGQQAKRAIGLNYHLDVTPLPQMPAKLAFASTIAHKGFVYVLGGFREGPMWGRPKYNKAVFKLDTRAMRWSKVNVPDTSVAPFPQQAAMFPPTNILQEPCIYVYAALHHEMWRFGLETEAWLKVETTGTPPPHVSKDFGAALAAHNGKLYVFSGSPKKEGVMYTLELSADGLEGRWQDLGGKGAPTARNCVGGVVVGQQLIVCGAHDGKHMLVPRAFDLNTHEWSQLAVGGADLPARQRFTLASQDNKLLLVGGQNAKGEDLKEIAVVELSKPHRMH